MHHYVKASDMTCPQQDAAHTCHTCSCPQQPKTQHRPAPLKLISSPSSSIVSSSQSKSAPPPESRMYGRGGAGARRRVVKPAKSEPDLKEGLSQKKSFKWVPKLPSSPEQTATPSLYDMPWDGQPQTPRTGASFASTSSSTSASSPWPRTPSDESPMAAQRDHFLSNLWRSKKSREPSSPSLLPNNSPMRSTFSSLSRQYTASSTTSSSRSLPYSCDDAASVSSHGTGRRDMRLTLPAFDTEKPGFMEETVVPRSSKMVVVEGSKSDDVAEVMHKLRLLK